VVEPSTLRRRSVACAIAVVLAMAGVAFLVQSLRARDDARTDLVHVRHQLQTERSTSSSAATQLAKARRAVQAIKPQLAGLATNAAALGKLDDQDRAAVQAAFQAGLAGDLGAFNTAVGQRTALDAQHDAALEELRKTANAVIGVLDTLRG